MNYFDLHIGDYDSATSHLTIAEDGAYGRLLRLYYRTEAPLPRDIKDVHRLVRAVTKQDRDVVTAVLREFFDLREDGWHQARADDEIARFREHQDAGEGRRKAARDRQQRARERRKELFDALRSRGITPRWNASTDELALELSRVTSRDKERDGHTPVTRDEVRDVTPDVTIFPPPTSHLPGEEALTPSVDAPPAPAAAEIAALLLAQSAGSREDPAPTRHGAIAVLLRSLGLSTHSAHPMVHEWATQGVTDEQIREAVAMARKRKPAPEQIPVAYLAPIVEDIRAPKKRSSPGWASSDEGIARRARELGIPESRWPGTYAELRAMCHERERSAA